MPFLAEHLWQLLVADACPDAPRSIFLARWPVVDQANEELLAEVAVVRQIVELGRQARAGAKRRLRQPLRRLVVEGADFAVRYAEEIADELRVKEVSFTAIDATELRVRPNLRVLGPRLGRELGQVRQALAAGDFEELGDGGFRVAGHDLRPADVVVQRTEKTGWAVATSDGISIALDSALDEELVLEGRVYDTIHRVNTLRRDSGLAITDRIRLFLPSSDRDLLRYSARIADDTLAVSVDLAATLTIEPV
jgi:isoleucyl-tRNA synthetase